jgi:predicted Zn-dependent protease
MHQPHFNEFSTPNPNRRQILRALSVLGVTGFGCAFCGCKTAPMTQRRQLILIPEGQEIALGAKAFQETMTTEQLSQNRAMAEVVSRVGQKIANVAGRNDYDWDFQLIASAEQNAFCLPGGKVAIYEGILPVCQNEAGLAVVMAHEVAHALARHGGERMSHSMAADRMKSVAAKLAGKYVPDKQAMLMQAYGLGAKYGVLLPYSRKQESEADHIGVKLMAEAGYDPIVAPEFWRRFDASKGEDGLAAEFMSTHPSDERRAQDLLALMDEAKSIYQRAPQKIGMGQNLI